MAFGGRTQVSPYDALSKERVILSVALAESKNLIFTKSNILLCSDPSATLRMTRTEDRLKIEFIFPRVGFVLAGHS